MNRLFGGLFGGRSEGRSNFLNEFAISARAIGAQRADAQRALNQQMAMWAGQAQGPGLLVAIDPALGSPVTGRELLARGNMRGGYQPTMFTRWMDIRESEDELQEFLAKCVAYGAKMQRPTSMSMKKLEAK